MSSLAPQLWAEALSRLSRLHSLSVVLSASLTSREIAEVVIGQAHDCLLAAASVVYLGNPEDGSLLMAASRGLPESVIEMRRRLPLDAPLPLATAVRTGEPQWLDRPALLAAYPSLAATPMDAAALQAVAALPLRIEGRTLGGIAFSFAESRPFSPADQEFLRTLAQQCAQALERSRLYEAAESARQEAEAAARRMAFLSGASQVLSASLDYERTLQAVVELAVPEIADCCSVDIIEGEDPAGWQIAVAHRDPAMAELIREMRRRYPPHLHPAHIVLSVYRSGRSQLIPEVPEEVLVARAVDEEHLGMMRALGLGSMMAVALSAPAGVAGVMTFGRTRSGRRFDAADLALAEELARRAALAIENARLYRAAREAIQIRDDFMAMAAHEFRTPLAAATLHAHRLMRMGPSGEQARSVQALARTLRQMEGLTGSLLEVSRIATGRFALAPETTNLADLIREIAERESESIRRAGCALRLTLDEAVGEWDPLRLDEVVTNLLSNAMKYGGEGLIEVTVAAQAERVRVTVRDHGPGIRPEDRSRIFSKFEQVSIARSHGGLGLGLWITRRIVEAMGGTITVGDPPGGGAAFTVELPLVLHLPQAGAHV